MTDAQQTSSTADLELRHDTAAHAFQALDGGRVVGEAGSAAEALPSGQASAKAREGAASFCRII